MNSTLSNTTVVDTPNTAGNGTFNMQVVILFISLWIPGVLCYLCIKCCKTRRVYTINTIAPSPLPPPEIKVPEGFGKAKVHPIDRYNIRVPDIPFYVVSPGNSPSIGVWKLENNKPMNDEV